MRVAAFELPHRFGQVKRQLEAVERLLEKIGPVDLAVLPEAALTGYVSESGSFDLTALAEPADGPTAKALAKLARAHRTAIAGPLIERDGERCFNTMLLFDSGGKRLAHYRKRRPWFPETWATAGDLGTPVVELGGLQLAPAICFDIHFLDELAPQAFDVLLFPSAWVEELPGQDARAEQLRELATRRKLAIVNANWGRGNPAVPGQGGSRIIDREGVEIARGVGLAPQAVVADLFGR